jgi:2'-5' RNA ligase
MAHALEMPDEWRTQGWKVKIRDDERSSIPHVTILRKWKAWRLSLRTGAFVSVIYDSEEVPAELVEFIWSRRSVLRGAWNIMYPENPVYFEENGR